MTTKRPAPIIMPPRLNEVSRVLLAARLKTLECEIAALRNILDPQPEPFARLDELKPYLSPNYPKGGRAK